VCTDADVAAVLSLAMNATCKKRKAAALALATILRHPEARPDELGSIIAAAARRYGDDIVAEARTIISELRLG
jgi:hypothetical protein